MQFYLRLALNIKKVYQKIATGSMKMANELNNELDIELNTQKTIRQNKMVTNEN